MVGTLLIANHSAKTLSPLAESNMAAVVRAGHASASILSYLVHQQSISSGSEWTFFKSPNNAKS